ncbi:hypothetical protein QQX98_007194 [Neonectria punicea]|uniref:Major facilitator superfamily (MFS) profile domain-containing protein n=1 Tax=Neonectria punicea TaxID=979145 RepID=A0ABR1GZ90_9HYPO
MASPSPKALEAASQADHKEVNSTLDTPTKEHDDLIDNYVSGPGVEIDAKTNKRLFWKINRRILVIQLVTYFCQSLDKGTLNFASIMGIKEDAKLVGQELSTILYIGILAGEYPQNFLLQKLPLAKMLSVNVFIWGAVVSCSAASTNFASLMAVSPMTAKCFSEEDKKLMIERVRHNETGIQNKKYKKYQIAEALTDPFVWCCVLLITVGNLIIGGLGVFSNLIIKEFGFSLLQTQLLNIAQGAWLIITMIGSAQASQKSGQTCLMMIIWTIPAMVGTIVILVVTPTSSNAGGMLIAFYCTQFFCAQGNMIISLITRNIAGQTKKDITMTMLFVGWSVGNLIAPQIFREKDAPKYLPGFLAHIVIYAVYIGLVVLTRIVLMAKNRRKVAAVAEITHELAFQDLTDVENPNFRYVY